MRRLVIAMAMTWLPLLALASCGTATQYFRPAENVVAQSEEGFPAAAYDLAHDNRRWGVVRVWSRGADREEASPTVLHVGFEVENVTDQPLELDMERTLLEAVRSHGGGSEFTPIAPLLVQGEAVTPGHSFGQLDLEFPMPPGIEPRDMRAFRIHWHMVGPDATEYEQHTPFLRQRQIYPRYHYSDYYWHDPYWHFGYPYRPYGFWGFRYGRFCY